MNTDLSSKQLTQEVQKEVMEYVRELNQLHTEIESNELLSVTHGKRTLAAALKCGDVLKIAKNVVKKSLQQNWGKWLSENVPAIELRTAQNYMKLATQVAIEKEGFNALVQSRQIPPETCFVSFLNECASLREAYIHVGIIKKKERKDREEAEKAKATPPDEVKESDGNEYKQRLADSKSEMVKYVRTELEKEGIVWDMNQWGIRNNKPFYTHERFSGVVVSTLSSLCHWVTLKNYSDLTREDAIEYKTSVIVSELLKIIIRTHNPSQNASVTGRDEPFQVQVVE